MKTRSLFRQSPLGLVVLLAMVGANGGAADQPAGPVRNPRDLMLLGPDYPRVFFFRAAEGAARRPQVTFDDWLAEYSRLMGIMGKCLDEEVLGTEVRNPAFFSRFKQQHPRQAALLHFNGNARDPRYHARHYHPGHWVYRQATRIVSDVPAESGLTTIQVEDAGDFRTQTGRYRTSNDDLGLFGIAPDGTHDWDHAEQVQLVSVDTQKNAIVVRRGCYGTQPLAFRAGRARAAAHAVEGPWGRNNHLMWFYNFATHCPRDARGRTANDLLVEDIAAWFGPGGKLAALDGIEFDVLFHQTHGDTTGDGDLDHGVVDGINRYGIGVIEFAAKLRQRMGDDFLILADGALGPGGGRSQRAWGLFNGIESEGWPNLNDWDFADWSGGVNRHRFWQQNARPPAVNYINHKWIVPVPGKPGEQAVPEVPFSRHRLVFAAAQFTDASLCYSFPPARDADGLLGIWDEFRAGEENRLGWLGRPEGPAVHVATHTPDLAAEQHLLAQMHGEGEIEARQGQRTFAAHPPGSADVVVSVPNIAITGSDLVVMLRMTGQPRKGYPATMARFAEVELSGGALSLMSPAPDETGMGLRGQPEEPLDRQTGAQVIYRRQQDIGGVPWDAFFVHPPYQNAKGYVYWCRDVEIAQGAELRFSLGMGEKSPERSDGVWFQVWAAEMVDGRPGQYTKLFERDTKAHRWIPCRVPLDEYAGRSVRLKFVADCGPHDHAVTDHGLWGHVRLATADHDDANDTPPRARMTWVNDHPFDSVFYFREIRSSQVRLTIRVEGPEPVSLERLEVYAAPDAMYRVFEHGLVLANPSVAAYSFDLQAISPGRRYRRLMATSRQDTVTNHGAPVSGIVELGERDALFLLRQPEEAGSE
jgi:hypothetical protein